MVDAPSFFFVRTVVAAILTFLTVACGHDFFSYFRPPAPVLEAFSTNYLLDREGSALVPKVLQWQLIEKTSISVRVLGVVLSSALL